MTWEALHSAKFILYPSTVAKIASKLQTKSWDKVTKTMFWDLNYLIHFIQDQVLPFALVLFVFSLLYNRLNK